MVEASAAVAKSEPGVVTLGDGSTVTVGKIAWIHFIDLWKELAEVVRDVLEVQTAQQAADLRNWILKGAYELTGGEEKPTSIKEAQTDAEDAQTAVQEVFEKAYNRVLEAPALIGKLINYTTKVDPAVLGDWPFDDVLQVAGAAVKLNFIDNQKVLSFFDNAMSAYKRAQTTGAENAPAKAKPKK